MKRKDVLAAVALLALLGAAPALAEEKAPPPAKKTYVCQPCQLACDEKTYDAPGVCPACGMALVEKVAPEEEIAPGKPAPDFTATDQDGKPVRLSDYRGKVVVLDFWEHW